jgi:hypothetical protein
MGGGLVFPNVEKGILENNLFGVDINNESVEIAKLSLWLRTAQPNRKLNDLSNNIKCGNSLIDDPEVAGDKAFNWEKEFPQIFAKGGFDVVIGNPPYVQITEYQDYYLENYFTSKCGDLYAIFYEKGFEILKNNGAFSYITPSLFIKGIRYESLREYLLEYTEILEIDDKGDGVFANVQMPTAIFVAIKNKVENQDWSKYIPGENITAKTLLDSKPLEEFTSIKRGLEIGKNKVYPFNAESIKILTGSDVERYNIKSFRSINPKTYDEFKKDNKFFESKRIVIRETGNRITSLIVDEDVQQNRSLYSILIDKNKFDYEYFLGIINSKLIQFFYKSKFAANTDVFPKIRIAQVKKLPIKTANKDIQILLVEKVKKELSKKDLKNKKVVITAGPTRESMDPVRFLTNHSSGKMGYALAQAASYRGAEVKLISGPSEVDTPLGVDLTTVETAAEMKEEVFAEFEDADIIIMAAAVSDYRPKEISAQKIKKSDGDLLLRLERTTDILAELGKKKKNSQLLVGFAAETENLLENAQKKLSKKQADYIIANDISNKNIGFGSDKNKVSILSEEISVQLPIAEKEKIANKIFDYILTGQRK